MNALLIYGVAAGAFTLGYFVCAMFSINSGDTDVRPIYGRRRQADR